MTTSVATQGAPLVATIDKTIMMNDTLMTIKAIPNVESKAFVLPKPSLKRPLDYGYMLGISTVDSRVLRFLPLEDQEAYKEHVTQDQVEEMKYRAAEDKYLKTLTQRVCTQSTKTVNQFVTKYRSLDLV